MAESPASFEAIGTDDPTIAVDSANRDENGAERLGLTVEVRSLGTRRVLEVTAVQPNSAAHGAGIEVGDTLVQANDVALTDANRLNEAIKASQGKLTLVVRDVRTGREVPVDVPLHMAMKKPTGSVRPLGLTTEIAFYQGESALKVTAVEANSPAHQAGIREGVLIIQANGAALASPEALTQAPPDANGHLLLKLFDPKDRSEGTVRVDLK
jgi:S1-C subfamily serine protease